MLDERIIIVSSYEISDEDWERVQYRPLPDVDDNVRVIQENPDFRIIDTNYAVTASTGENGIVAPQTAIIAAGDYATFTATPNEGYQVSKWIVNGEESAETGNELTIRIVEDTTVEVSFEEAASTYQLKTYIPSIGPELEVLINGDWAEGTTYREEGYSIYNINTGQLVKVNAEESEHLYTEGWTWEPEGVNVGSRHDDGGANVWYEFIMPNENIEVSVEYIEG